MEQDHKDILTRFNEHGVEYVIVGGIAVSAHGIPRYTKNLDLFIRSSLRNSEKVFQALAAFGAPIVGSTPEDFRDGKTVLQIGLEPNRIDILQTLAGVEFGQVWENRVEARIDGSLTAPVISREDLILNKTHAGRERDLADVAELKRMKQKEL